MSTETPKQIDIGELLQDIDYVNKTVSEEIERVKTSLQPQLNGASLPGTVAGPLIDEISTQLGHLAAKVKLTEKTSRLIRQELGASVETGYDSIGSFGNTPTLTLRFAASQLVGNKNLFPVNTSANGVSYRWSGSDPETRFEFPLDRSNKLGMQIRIFALIKSEYLKQLKVLIDGHHIKHRISTQEGPIFVVSCTLPSSDKASHTAIKIVLPGTYSPIELGESQDERKLGIAINEFRFSKPESGFTHLLKRLRLFK